MGRYGPFRVAAGDGGGCLPLPIVASEAALAVVDGAIATAAFVQLARIHRYNQQQGWTRQKIFHFMIGLSNVVFLVYFLSTIIATCQRWIYWVHGCGFVLMASPQILLLASFLLLLSFWVDLCHQTNDEDEEDVRSHHEALLDRTQTKPGIHPVNIRWRCCPGMQLGSRQKFVILVLVLSFVVMFAFAILIWVGRGENPIDSSILKRVYLDVFSVVVLVLGGALACYGALLFTKMCKVRSETISTEKWKVASLAAISLICFSSSAILALVTNVPVLLYWHSTNVDIINNAVILFVYYFIVEQFMLALSFMLKGGGIRLVSTFRVCFMDHERYASSAGSRKAHRIKSGYSVQGKTIKCAGSTVEDSSYILKQVLPTHQWQIGIIGIVTTGLYKMDL